MHIDFCEPTRIVEKSVAAEFPGWSGSGGYHQGLHMSQFMAVSWFISAVAS